MKTMALILCLVMVLGSFAYAEEVQLISASTKDYEGHWAQATIQKWMDAGKVSGYPDGSYRPDANVTRAEFVKLVNGIIDFNKKANLTYKDVPSTEWYYDYVGVAQEIGYISGYSADKFGPNDNITREQAASILSRIQYLQGNESAAAKFTDNSKISSWAKASVGAASEAGFISGYSDGSLKPLKNLTRAEALTMIDNVLVNSKNVVVYNAGAELKDAVVEGDLIIAKTVGEGDVHLTNVDVKGNIYVYGGGVNSVYFNNMKVSKIIVEKDQVRLVFEEGTTVEEVKVTTEVVLENTDGTIAKVTVAGEDAVTLTGKFDEVVIVGNSDIVLNDANIQTLVVEKSIVIQGTGEIAALTANVDGITYEAEVTIKKTVTGEGVTEAPAPVEAPVAGGGGGGAIVEPSYKIAFTAVIDGTTYNPLFTSPKYTGTENISIFLRNSVVNILNINNNDIEGYFTKLNNKIGNLKISGVQVNTEAGLDKIQEELIGTSIVSGFVDGIFSDGELSEAEFKTILNEYTTSDLSKFGAIDLEKTLVYGDAEVEPTFKFNGATKTRTELQSIMVTAAGKTIDEFFTSYGTTVTIESTSTIGGVDKVTSVTIKRVE